MRLVLSTTISLLLLLSLSLMLLVNEAVEDHARVSSPPSHSRQDMFRVQQLLADNDPRSHRPGIVRRLSLSEHELNLMANHFLRQFAPGATRLALAPGRVAVDMTLPLGENPFGPFLNLKAVVRTDLPPELLTLSLGPLELPAWLARWLGEVFLERLRRDDGLRALLESIESVQADDRYLTVVYRWQSAMSNELKRRLLGPEEADRLRHYHGRLAEQTRTLKPRHPHSLSALLSPLLGEARSRSVDGDPAAENRAALLVLALYVNGLRIESLTGGDYAGERPRPLHLTLRGHRDLAQHFAVSAALAAAGGSVLADAAGLYKEIRDSEGGSGFSFKDLAADRAGTRFGELATYSRASARRLQDDLASGIADDALMPATAGLPRTMTARELELRVGAIGSPGFQRLQEEIERRIDAMPLYARKSEYVTD